MGSEKDDRELFDRIALNYCRKDTYPVSKIAREYMLNCLIDELKKVASKNDFREILELGCGVGASSEYLEGTYQNYIGIDHSKEMIRIANDSQKKDNVIFKCANIKDINNTSTSLDFVFGVGILHHVSEIDKLFQELHKIGNNKTMFGFIEPQSGNPIIQLMRMIRKFIDKEYSNDQVFFSIKEIGKILKQNGFIVDSIKYQGYITPPFTQIILKPKFLFYTLSKMAIRLDRWLMKNFNNSLSWNIIILAHKKID